MKFLAWLVMVAGVCLITWPCPLLAQPYLSWYMETVLRTPASSTAAGALPLMWLCYSVPAGLALLYIGSFAMEWLQKRS